MVTHATTSNYTIDMRSDDTWRDLYPLLRTFVEHLVFSFRVPAWQGQEYDIVEDIVQESALRLIEYAQKVERGEAIFIRSYERFMKVIASNYCKDLYRRDRRLIRASSDDDAFEVSTDVESCIDPSESGTEEVYQEWLFTLAAHEIARFPDKQRGAILRDLANRMCFEKQLTPLQQALLKAGIQIQEYRHPLLDDKGRNRHASLLSVAYKRLIPSLRIPENMEYGA